MTNQIGYATTATEAQKLREEFGCIVLIELGTDNSVLKSIAASLKEQDVFISNPENPTVQAYIPVLKQNGVQIGTRGSRHLSASPPPSTYVKGKGTSNPQKDAQERSERLSRQARAKEQRQKVKTPVVGRPRSSYIDDLEIMGLKDERGMSFREIAEYIGKRAGVEVSPSIIHNAYTRAKAGKS